MNKNASPKPAGDPDNAQLSKLFGSRALKALKAVGISSVSDLLEFQPRRYLDRTEIRAIRDIKENEETTVVGEVVSATVVTYGRRRLLVRVEDGSGIMEAVWFNRADLFSRIFKVGQTVAFSGKVTRFRFWQMVHPDFDIISEQRLQLNTGQIIPIYPSTQELKKADVSHYKFRKVMAEALKKFPQAGREILPLNLIHKYHLLSRPEALQQMHFPDSADTLQEARRRFKYEELFFLELLMAWYKRKFQIQVPGPRIESSAHQWEEMLRSLPFSLTAAQQRVLTEIRRDLALGRVMNRLLQGDVGSGKTVVALLAMRLAAAAGWQSALMAPTELLAQQHYENIRRLLPSDSLRVALITGSLAAKTKRALQDEISGGQWDILCGTHALIQEGVSFAKLGLVVIDEQHRFGVQQRRELISKGTAAHALIMTATPIPRTLALTLYGDLDVSVIDEMPPGRRPVRTAWRDESKLRDIYAFLRKRMAEGDQVYVVYPLIEESEKVDLKAATAAYEYLRKKVFPEFSVALLHGRQKAAEKDKIMAGFRDGRTQMLVSTTVIEVGVDVPNATIMLIEHAERFGLSQLHQLRGRVGRGSKESYCILITPAEISEVARERMAVMEQTTDGFVIAEADLRLRGSGEFFGTRQHGMPNLRFADLAADQKIVGAARSDAFEIVEHDPHLRAPELAATRAHFLERWAGKLDVANTA